MARDAIVRDGEEVVVETGTGIVTKFERTSGGRNARVEFRATHTNLKDPVSCWLDTFDETLTGYIDEGHRKGLELEYRIEVHRKAGVDKARRIAELGNREKVRDLVKVHPAREGRASPPENPPPPAPDSPSPGRNGATAPDTAPERVAGFQAPSAPPARAARNVEEAKPWEPLNSDGSPNLGSYAVTAGAGMVDLAVEVILEAGVRPGFGLVQAAAAELMVVADAIQAGGTGNRSDRMDASHTRARGLLRTVLRLMPFPVAALGEPGGRPVAGKVLEEWRTKAANAGVALLNLAVDLSGVDWRRG